MTEVTCAVIRNDEGLLLAVRRGHGMSNAGKWEFPGGKTRAGESHDDCIIREIDEELGMNIIITGMLEPVEHDYGNRRIRLIPFLCETLASKPVLKEHDEYRWLTPSELEKLDLTPPDIVIAKQLTVQNTPVATESTPESDAVIAASGDEEMAKFLGGITSLTEITMVAHSAVSDPGLVSQLVSLSFSGEKRVGFMASWALSKVADINVSVLAPYLGHMIDALPGVPNESVQRSLMRVIMKSDPKRIPLSHHARLMEYCLGIMRTANGPVAPKAYAMEILGTFCSIYPDMINEVTEVVQIALSDAAGGMKAAGRKLIVRLSRKDKKLT